MKNCRGTCGFVIGSLAGHPDLPPHLRRLADVIQQAAPAALAGGVPVVVGIAEQHGKARAPGFATMVAEVLVGRGWAVRVTHTSTNFLSSACRCDTQPEGSCCPEVLHLVQNDVRLVGPRDLRQYACALHSEQRDVHARAVRLLHAHMEPIFGPRTMW